MMTEPARWSLTTWEGSRRRQLEDFKSLTLREKILVIEHLGEVAEFFMARRKTRGLPVRERRTRD